MPRGTTKGQEFWRRHSSAYEASGCSQRAYCKQHGLSAKTLARWRVVFRKEARRRDACLVEAPQATLQDRGHDPLVPVSVLASSPRSDSIGPTASYRGDMATGSRHLVIWVGHHLRVEFGCEVSLDYIEQLVLRLRGVPQ
jgi:hypothetical protein